MRITESRIRQIIREETSKILEQIDLHYPDVGDIVTRIIKYEEYNSDVSYTGPDPENPPGIPSDELSSNFARGRHADEMYATLEAMQETGFITFNPKSEMYFLTPKAMEMFVDGEWTGPDTNMLYDEMERSKNAQAPAAAPKSDQRGAKIGASDEEIYSVVERFITPFGQHAWNKGGAGREFSEMAQGGDGGGERKKYPHWKDSDFLKVINYVSYAL